MPDLGMPDLEAVYREHGIKADPQKLPSPSEYSYDFSHPEMCAWSHLNINDQIHWKRARSMSPEEYQNSANYWWNKIKWQENRGPEPSKELLIHALMTTGIAQVLGIDRTDSKNLLFETNIEEFQDDSGASTL